MAGEQAEAVPEDLRTWLAEKAQKQGTSPRDVLVRAIVAYRFLEGESETLEQALDERFADTESRVDDLSARVDDAESALTTRVADVESELSTVRDRLEETRREVESRAPADHDHPDVEATAREALETAEEAELRVSDLDDRLEAGFENYEEVLSYLTETTDELEGKLDTVASVLTTLRRQSADLEARLATREAVDDLREAANRHGDRTAACEDCGSSIDVGLLTAPACPHCGATFVGFEPGPRFFGSATLTVGDRPALEGDVATDEVDELFETDDAGAAVDGPGDDRPDGDPGSET
jgi:chromosome segregation ATPase